MKRNPITLVTGGVLALIFGLMLFTFQVRQTEIAVVTTLGKPTGTITNAGFNLRLPWPIQKVHLLDNRVQNFERKFEQTTTKDAINLLITVYAGWRVANDSNRTLLYFNSFFGDPAKAEQALEPLLRNVKNGVIGQHIFGDLVSTNEAALKFDLIEKEMLAAIQPQASNVFGIDIQFLGIKQLGLPEMITTKVFDRMKAERNTRAAQFRSEGERAAKMIRSDADNLAEKILSEAKATAIEINGGAEAKASEYYKVMQQNPELAIFLFQLNALEASTKERTTLMLDQQTAPFNMLGSQGANIATPPPSK